MTEEHATAQNLADALNAFEDALSSGVEFAGDWWTECAYTHPATDLDAVDIGLSGADGAPEIPTIDGMLVVWSGSDGGWVVRDAA